MREQKVKRSGLTSQREMECTSEKSDYARIGDKVSKWS